MSLIFKLTDAGRAALVNAANDGTLARTVVSVGLTATAIAPGATIAGEIKRVTTIAGDVVADDTIHVTIRDDGPDSYTVRGIGLYLDNGVLLGSYGQALPIIEKSSASILLLATDMRVLDGSVDISTLLFGDTTFLNPPATTDRQGVVELATPAETAAGADAVRAVTPAGLKPLLDEKQSLDAELSALAALLSAANKLPYFTGAGTAALTDLSAFARTLLDDANAATARATLGANDAGNLTAGTLDLARLVVALASIGGLTPAANKLPYYTGAGSAALADLSAFARTLLDDADEAAARTTLGAAPLVSPAFTGTPTAPTQAAGNNTTRLATTAFVQAAVAALVASSPTALDTLKELADALGNDPNFATTMVNALAGKQPLDAELTALAGLASAANKLPYFTGSGTAALADLSAFARTLLDDANAAAALATLGAAPLASPTFTGTPAAVTAAAGTSTNQLATTAFVQAAVTVSHEPGQVVAFARSTAPNGWLKANGAAVSRTTYAALFEAIGTVFGAGNGSTTFNLPDLRGEFVRGWDDGRGIDSGRAFGSSQTDDLKSHTHNGVIRSFSSFGFAGGGLVYWAGNDGLTNATGGAETRPRNIALLICIKF